MPAGKESDSDTGTVKRTTFRPPWVKEGPSPLPAPAPQWTLKAQPRKDSTDSTGAEKQEYNPLAEVQLKPTKVNKKPPPPDENGEEGVRKNKILAGVQLKKVKKSEPKESQENGAKESFFQKPTLKPVKQREKSPPRKDYKLHNLPTLQKASERVLKSPPRKSSLARSDTLSSDEDVEIDKEVPKKRNALVREASMRRLSQSNIPPPPPPQPGMPPPPPMMPGEKPKKPLTDRQKSRLNKLRARPKNRPDWSNLLQEIESKKALKHVVCNDRSNPILPEAKGDDEHLIYKSEEPNVHNELLKQIEKGVYLKRVKTNDRSKPNLDGLRKFRRQMTIEEQIQKSISMASIPPISAQDEITTEEIDEMDDIDKVRDDLQSTKQMLAIELRNKEAQERENKRLISRIQNLQAELEKEKSKNQTEGNTTSSSDSNDKVITGLKKEVDEARKSSQELEKKYTETAEELDTTKSKLEDLRRQNQMLEKRLQDSMMGKRNATPVGRFWFDDDDGDDLENRKSGKGFSPSDRKQSAACQGSDEELEDEEPEEESDGEDNEEKREKRSAKELKMLRKKLQSLKNKEDNAKKERLALREIIKKHQSEMKEEIKKYKQLKKEVDKMAALMKDTDDDEDVEEEEEKEAEEEESEEEESTEEEESDSDGDDTDSEQSQSEEEDAPSDKHKENLTARNKRHENLLNALKKGNFLLKTNAERLQDDLNKQKEMTASLKEDLDSVLSELG